MSTDILVVGGGAIGVSIAYHLARERQQVTLLERRGIAAEASGANVGLVCLSTKTGALWELARTSIVEKFPKLSEELDFDIAYDRCGALHLYTTDAEREHVLSNLDPWASQHIGATVLDGKEIRDLEPVLGDAIQGGVLVDSDGVVYPLAMALGFAHAARRLGARIETGPGAEVLRVRAEGGRVTGVETRDGFRAAGTVVLANGAWVKALCEPLGFDVPITPLWGEVIITEAVPRMIHHVLLGVEPSARQTEFGNILIGSTVEDRGFDTGVDLGATREYAHGAARLFPGLKGLRVIRSWAGLRPCTPDVMPILQWAPGVDGLFIASGHSRNGVCYAPATGQIVADMIVRGSTWPWASAFTLERFGAVNAGGPA